MPTKKTTAPTAPEPSIDDETPDVATATLSSSADRAAKLEMEAVAACNSYLDRIEAYEACRVPGAVWGLPDEFASWHVYRCGTKASPEALRLREELRRQGFVEAPSSVYILGAEKDGDNGIYMMCPPQVTMTLREIRRRKALQKSAILDSRFGKHALRGMQGASVKVIDEAYGTASEGDAKEAMRKVRASIG